MVIAYSPTSFISLHKKDNVITLRSLSGPRGLWVVLQTTVLKRPINQGVGSPKKQHVPLSLARNAFMTGRTFFRVGPPHPPSSLHPLELVSKRCRLRELKIKPLCIVLSSVSQSRRRRRRRVRAGYFFVAFLPTHCLLFNLNFEDFAAHTSLVFPLRSSPHLREGDFGDNECHCFNWVYPRPNRSFWIRK